MVEIKLVLRAREKLTAKQEAPIIFERGFALGVVLSLIFNRCEASVCIGIIWMFQCRLNVLPT